MFGGLKEDSVTGEGDFGSFFFTGLDLDVTSGCFPAAEKRLHHQPLQQSLRPAPYGCYDRDDLCAGRVLLFAEYFATSRGTLEARARVADGRVRAALAVTSTTQAVDKAFGMGRGESSRGSLIRIHGVFGYDRLRPFVPFLSRLRTCRFPSRSRREDRAGVVRKRRSLDKASSISLHRRAARRRRGALPSPPDQTPTRARRASGRGSRLRAAWGPPSEPRGCGSRRCRRRTWRSCAGPGSRPLTPVDLDALLGFFDPDVDWYAPDRWLEDPAYRRATHGSEAVQRLTSRTSMTSLTRLRSGSLRHIDVLRRLVAHTWSHQHGERRSVGDRVVVSWLPSLTFAGARLSRPVRTSTETKPSKPWGCRGRRCRRRTWRSCGGGVPAP